MGVDRLWTTVLSLDYFLLAAFLLVTVTTVSGRSNHKTPGDTDGPCLGCHLFNFYHRKHPEKKPDTVFCHYPCQCPIEVLECSAQNRTKIKDGCGCCYMCARQLREACTVKDLCDSAKELVCERRDDKSVGVCKGTHKENSCFVNGAVYQHGETFAPDCSQVCNCQNGFYGCSSQCPHERVKPSELTCHDPKLIKVKNKCCREWTCQKMGVNESSLLSARRGLESQSLVRRDLQYRNTTLVPPTTTVAVPPGERGVAMGPCRQKRNSNWTPCSVTCGTGVSVRTIVDPVTCATAQELRLCLLRPCDEKFEREKCTSTVKSEYRRRIFYQDCISVKDYRLKFCDTCRKNKCCFPKKTRERRIRFQCAHGKREVFKFMWIKKCRCAPKCYGKSSKRNKSKKRSSRDKKRRARGNRKSDRKGRRRKNKKQ